MNAPQPEIERRKNESERIRLLFEDFRKSEQAVIDKAVAEFAPMMAEALPRLHGYALESNVMVQTATFTVTIDLTTGKKAVGIQCVTVPPPCSIKRSSGVFY